MTDPKIAQCFNGIVDIQRHMVGMKTKQDSIGQRLVESKSWKDFLDKKNNLITVDLTPMEIKAVVSTGAINDPLVISHAPAIDGGVRRKLTIRDLLPTFPTVNGAVEFPTKTLATTGSPAIQNRENTAFGESAYTFGTTFQPVQTIGHTLPMSSQVLEDSGTLDAFFQTELLHGLGVEEQDQLLNGSNAASQLNGLITAATAYASPSPALTLEADIIRSAMRQVEAADFNPTAIVLNTQDWYDIDVNKAGASDDTYTAGNPRAMREPSLWGLPVVVSNSIASGTFLVGDFKRAAVLFDRQQPQIEISRHHNTHFEKGMLQALATERLALVVTNSSALVTGSL